MGPFFVSVPGIGLDVGHCGHLGSFGAVDYVAAVERLP